MHACEPYYAHYIDAFSMQVLILVDRAQRPRMCTYPQTDGYQYSS